MNFADTKTKLTFCFFNMAESENMADVDQGVDVVELVSFEGDCELTIIDESSTSERTVDKCHRSTVWHYFNKLLGDERSKYTCTC